MTRGARATFVTVLVAVLAGGGCLKKAIPMATSEQAAAETYVRLVLALGRHDEAFVDAYYGPEALRTEVAEAAWSLEDINKRAAVLEVDLRRLPPADKEHRRLVRLFIRRLVRAGLVGVDRYVGLAGTAHALGSLVMGDDPRTSVVDADCRSWDTPNLWVCDGSVFPTVGGVNPSLTIQAIACRTADRIRALAGRGEL